MTNREYYKLLLNEIVISLVANMRIKNFTKNTAIIGAFAEESVNEIIKKIVFPFRVSTGSVFSKDLLESSNDLPQIDCIVWNPSPFPAIFEKGNFALIPYQGSLGIMEIKTSNYSNVGSKIKNLLDREKEFVKGSATGIDSDGNLKVDEDPKSLGVICIFDSSKSDSILDDLIKKEKVAIILEHNGDFNINPSNRGILTLINFLMLVRKRGLKNDGNIFINIDVAEID